MKPVVVVASRSGGVGKTLLAQLVAGLRFDQAGSEPWSFEPVSIDTMGVGERSKLGRLYADCVELPMTPTLEASEIDGGLAMRMWQTVAARIEAGGRIIDFGANTAPLFAQALTAMQREGSFKSPSRLSLLVPAMASAQALANAREAVEQIGFSPTWRHCNIVVVLNEAHGLFGQVSRGAASPDLTWILNREREDRLSTVCLPRCCSLAWSAIEESRCSVIEAISIDDLEFARRFGFHDSYRSAQARALLVEWAHSAILRLRDAGIFEGASS